MVTFFSLDNLAAAQRQTVLSRATNSYESCEQS